MQYVTAIVHKDAEIKLPVAVPEWEIPVLEAKFSEVEVTGTVEGQSREFEADSEYMRLSNKHGRDPETKQPFVQIAYGQEHEGRLTSAMEGALVAAESTSADSADLDDVERQEIVEQLDAMGIEYNPRSRTPTLRKALDQALEAIESGGDEDTPAE